MKRLSVIVVITLIACWSGTVGAAAQNTTGVISGRIVDGQGLALPGVAVKATGAQGAKSTMSDGEGRFTIPFLTPGNYSVQAELGASSPWNKPAFWCGSARP